MNQHNAGSYVGNATVDQPPRLVFLGSYPSNSIIVRSSSSMLVPIVSKTSLQKYKTKKIIGYLAGKQAEI